MKNGTLAKAAINYAENGLKIFPLAPKGKTPLTNHGFKDATNDIEQIRDWWEKHPNANIGLVTGQENKLFVIDVDGDIPNHFPSFNFGATVKTSKGVHHYIEQDSTKRVNCRTKINGLDIDVRGDGGYVVAPPSIHSSGEIYTFLDGFKLNTCTEEIMTFINSNKNTRAERKPIGDTSLLSDDIDQVVSALQAIPNDLNYADWIRISAAFKAAVGGREEYYHVYEEWALQWRDNTRDHVRQKWISIKDAEAGAGTIFYEAKKRGWSFPKVFSKETPYETAEAILTNRFQFNGTRTLIYMQDFYIWQGGHYHLANEEQIKKIISEELETAYTVKKDLKAPFNPKRNDILEVFEAIKNKTLPASNHLRKPPFWIKKSSGGLNPLEILCVENGLLHIPTQRLLPHTPDLFIVNGLPYKYDPKSPTPTHWLNFLKSIWPDDEESIECLQMWMGYLLIADTSYQKILIITGPPRSGKGTISRVISNLLGKNNVASPQIGNFDGFGLQPLINKSVALINDARPPKSAEAVRKIIETLLNISGEDSISIQRKYKENWEGRLTSRLMLFSNEVPIPLKDASHALNSRLLHLKMKESFIGKEDISLNKKLEGELPGILNWAIEGYIKLKEKKGFSQPASGEEALEELKASSNPLSNFISDCCLLDKNASTKTHALRDAFYNYGGNKHINEQEFGKLLSALHLNINKVKKSNGYNYVGIGLKPHHMSEFNRELKNISIEDLM